MLGARERVIEFIAQWSSSQIQKFSSQMSEYSSGLSESLRFYENEKKNLSQMVWPQTNSLTEMTRFMKEAKKFKVEASSEKTKIEV